MSTFRSIKWKLCITGCLVLIGPLTALCSGFTGVGNGGYAAQIKDDPKTYLYDFLEAGIENSASLSIHNADDLASKEILKKALPLSQQHIDEAMWKLNEIAGKHAAYAKALLEFFQKYRWLMVRPELMPTGDLGDSPLHDKNISLLQLALRDDEQHIVYINRGVWDSLELVHQIGLLFHEVNFAFIKEHTGINNSSTARILTAFVFDPRFEAQTQNDILSVLTSLGLNENDYVEYSQECLSIKKRYSEWFPKISREFSLYMKNLETHKTKYGNGAKILDWLDAYDDLSDYQSSYSNNNIGNEYQHGQFPSFIVPQSPNTIPRQIGTCNGIEGKDKCSGEIYETFPEKNYASIERLAKEGKLILAANDELASCISDRTEKLLNINLLKMYSNLKPADLLRPTKKEN